MGKSRHSIAGINVFMCGISGIVSLVNDRIPNLERKLSVMNDLLEHRGPDGHGVWTHPDGCVGFAHRRLSIIDIKGGAQPMRAPSGDWVTYNGEIYNYLELKNTLGSGRFRTGSDTEVILHAFEKWGVDCLDHFKGMYGFGLWDESEHALFCARDRFGIKPFYYTVNDDCLYFASEAKALLPFVKSIETDLRGLREYLNFQLCLNGHTLFKGVYQLPPAHRLTVRKGEVRIDRYWEAVFQPDFDHSQAHFEDKLRGLLEDSVRLHLRSDVPVGAYVSGGLDSSTVASLAKDRVNGELVGFTGKFAGYGEGFDESKYARSVAEWRDFPLHEIDISVDDFVSRFDEVVYHMDYPVAGPGSFPQYMVSELASQHRKVVLGGQGGDEIFGGYTRYLVAYFEQCVKAAIDGTMNDGNFIVTYESIIPNLTALKNYKPMLKQFWSQGLFEPMDRRYYQLINRAPQINGEVRWEALGEYDPFETFQEIFNGLNVRKKASYFDSMTNFDFKTLLPALLHVEDRVSMAHGLEARVPLLDHELVEKACTAPSDIKFKDGSMKYLFKKVVAPYLPEDVLNRTDKMGFPTPLNDWINDGARDYVMDIMTSSKARARDFIDNQMVADAIHGESTFSRKTWGFLNLEMWQQRFHDREHEFKQLIS